MLLTLTPRFSKTNTKKDVLFITGDWNAKVESQDIPEITGSFGLGVQNEVGWRLTVFPRGYTGHNKHTFPKTQEMTLQMDITKWSILKSDWLYSLNLKMEIYCCFSVSPSCLTPWTAAHRLPFPSPTPRVCSNSCPLSWWCHPTTSSSIIPFSSCLQFFSASGSFPMSQLFASGGQIIGASASASFLPMNIQDWFPLGLTSLSFLQSKGLSRSFLQPHSLKASIFWCSAFFYCPTLTSTHDYWKNHSFDYMDLCRQSNVSAF